MPVSHLYREHAILVVIDVQEKLTAVIHDGQELQANVARLIRGCHMLGVPALLTEQYPKGIGPTTELVASAWNETYGKPPIQKMCFSSYGCSEFAGELEASGRRHVIVAGIEAHVCVFQTVSDLLGRGLDVFVVADAVSSRTARNRDIALDRMAQDGAKWTSTEMALFQMTVSSEAHEFKAISKLVK